MQEGIRPEDLQDSTSPSPWTFVRRYLLTGIVVIAPVGVTAFVLYWIFVRLDAIVGRFLGAALGIQVPGLGLLALLLLLVGVGWVAQQAVGRQLINLGRRSLLRFPLTRSIYNAASQIIETLVGQNRKFFKACVLIEYPSEGLWTLGFVTSRATEEVSEIAGERALAVFVPTAPNPTSGYLLFVPASRVWPLKLTVEEGFRAVISGGAVIPGIVPGSTSTMDVSRMIERGERDRRAGA